MNCGSFKFSGKEVFIDLKNPICEKAEDLLYSNIFGTVLKRYIKFLEKKNSFLLDVFENRDASKQNIETFVKTLEFLTKMSYEHVSNVVEGSEMFFKDTSLLNDFIEQFYNYWRSYDRFFMCANKEDDSDLRPYRTFNDTIHQISRLIRGVYRDIQENITNQHPRIYRQVSAGAVVAVRSIYSELPWKHKRYKMVDSVPVIRQLLLNPPLILDPPNNKRKGKFERIDKNPFDSIELKKNEWLCYPAKVGELVIMVYFHREFHNLGLSLANLFELADDEDLKRQPDAIYAYGVNPKETAGLGEFQTVFHEDTDSGMFVATCPRGDEYGYFGYLKKMMLTLHNSIMIKRKKFPFHGALTKIFLKGGKEATILLMGDSGAGKSETLESFRSLGGKYIQDMLIIADDMGTVDLDKKGNAIGYGTEIGAFLRLDDLQPGYAFGQIDRAIIMGAGKVNSRIIMPVTSFDNIIKGQKIDYILYANNYEEIDEDHPVIERFESPEQAVKVFREGTVMSKGTTATKGIVHSYFANIFGPPEYKEQYDGLANKFFDAFVKQGIYVGQMRTRLGIPGWEQNGPEAAAKALLETILEN